MRRTENSSWTKNGVFFTAGSWEKDTIFGAARKFFGPSYFVMALEVPDTMLDKFSGMLIDEENW